MEPITIQLSAAVSAAAWIGTGLLGAIALLIGAVVWFLRRELAKNDKAHAELRGDIRIVETDIKKLLEGLGRVEGTLNKLAQ